jgi:hypothetical protein
MGSHKLPRTSPAQTATPCLHVMQKNHTDIRNTDTPAALAGIGTSCNEDQTVLLEGDSPKTTPSDHKRVDQSNHTPGFCNPGERPAQHNPMQPPLFQHPCCCHMGQWPVAPLSATAARELAGAGRLCSTGSSVVLHTLAVTAGCHLSTA